MYYQFIYSFEIQIAFCCDSKCSINDFVNIEHIYHIMINKSIEIEENEMKQEEMHSFLLVVAISLRELLCIIYAVQCM